MDTMGWLAIWSLPTLNYFSLANYQSVTLPSPSPACSSLPAGLELEQGRRGLLLFYFYLFAFRQFYYEGLAVLEHTTWTRLASNSYICLLLPRVLG